MTEPPALAFAVLQPGARMHYAVPVLLERAGMLRRFYTDLCASLPPWEQLARVWPERLQPAAVRRLFGRRLPAEIPAAKVRHVAGRLLQRELAARFGRAPGSTDVSDALFRLVKREQFAGANALYTVLINADLDLCAEARARGIQVVHEVMISPDVGFWLKEEEEEYVAYRSRYSLSEIEFGRARDRRKYALSDLIIVPSAFVKRAVLELGAPPGRVREVPYGVDERWLQVAPSPEPGRVLFVGSVGLRKGVHHLAAATRILQRRRVQCDVRVVGPGGRELAADPLFRGPQFVGPVPRSDIVEEFRRADIFVLPSLCEGSATVVYEALACGLPVITTPNSGSIVRDGIEGFVVPVRDPAAIADRIEQLVSDRSLRKAMSDQARARAAQFTWSKYATRLVGALSGLSSIPRT